MAYTPIPSVSSTDTMDTPGKEGDTIIDLIAADLADHESRIASVVSSVAGITSYTTEKMQDDLSATIVNGTPTLLTITYNDAANTLTFSVASQTPTLANAPANSVFIIRKSGSTWPARSSARTDITFLWVGADPSPAIVASGTGGMLDGVDLRLVV